MRCLLCLLVFTCSQPFWTLAQSCKTTAKFIDNKSILLKSFHETPQKELVNLKTFIPSLMVEMPYATVHNFTKTILYKNPKAYLRREPAKALKKIQDELHKRGLSLKVYDAFRPFSVSCKMWQLIHDSRYVADPEKGSGHNRGLAVDLTLIDLRTGNELDMGTGFDSFTDSANHAFTQLPETVLTNRQTLKTIMEKYGFNSLPTEWWHYSWSTKHEYEIIDLNFDELNDVLKTVK